MFFLLSFDFFIFCLQGHIHRVIIWLSIHLRLRKHCFFESLSNIVIFIIFFIWACSGLRFVFFIRWINRLFGRILLSWLFWFRFACTDSHEKIIKLIKFYDINYQTSFIFIFISTSNTWWIKINFKNCIHFLISFISWAIKIAASMIIRFNIILKIRMINHSLWGS